MPGLSTLVWDIRAYFTTMIRVFTIPAKHGAAYR
jgi:hypothetical protein